MVLFLKKERKLDVPEITCRCLYELFFQLSQGLWEVLLPRDRQTLTCDGPSLASLVGGIVSLPFFPSLPALALPFLSLWDRVLLRSPWTCSSPLALIALVGSSIPLLVLVCFLLPFRRGQWDCHNLGSVVVFPFLKPRLGNTTDWGRRAESSWAHHEGKDLVFMLK